MGAYMGVLLLTYAIITGLYPLLNYSWLVKDVRTQQNPSSTFSR